MKLNDLPYATEQAVNFGTNAVRCAARAITAARARGEIALPAPIRAS